MIETARSKFKRSVSLTRFLNYFKSLGLFKIVLALGFIVVFAFFPALRDLTIETLAEAYIQVSCFVAATFALFYALENYFNIDTKSLLKKYTHYQVPISALMGALPGCGGAIIIVTQYVRGRISFGAIVAALTSTMGDAAFLLLAQEPLTGLMIFGIGLSVGIVSGYFIDFIHGPDFLRPEEQVDTSGACSPTRHHYNTPLNTVWIIIVIPGFFLAIMAALQILPENDLITAFGAFGAFLSIIIWGYLPEPVMEHEAGIAQNQKSMKDGCICDEDAPAHIRVINDTSFVTAWVVMAFLVYEYFTFLSGFDLHALFQSWLYFIPMIAILIGFIPGCGPQVVVTTLYLQGIIPLSAQIGNAISNDGDALFPAIALAPKASIIATLYSAVPAIILAYLWLFLFEM